MFEIGNSLREARLRRGIDFAQAEAATKVRGKYLRALEDEQFELLPAQTYVKGFLRTYAEYLGLDGQLYVDEYNSRFVVGEEDYRPRRSSVRPQTRNRRLETNVVLVALALVAIVTIGVVSAWKAAGGHDVPEIRRTAVVTPKPKVAPAFLLIRALRGPSHLDVRRGSAVGDVVFEGTISRGQALRFDGPRLWMQVTSPENLRIVAYGKTYVFRAHRPLVAVVTQHRIRRA